MSLLVELMVLKQNAESMRKVQEKRELTTEEANYLHFVEQAITKREKELDQSRQAPGKASQ